MRRVLVTGGTGFIGYEVAKRLASRGLQPRLLVRRPLRAAELAPKIRVHAISPSLTRTTLAAGIVSNEAIATTISGLHALQRLGEPEDIASAAAYLISSDAAWITGQVIGIDGGRSSIRAKG